MKYPKPPDVVLTNDTAWTTLEALKYSRRVLESMLNEYRKHVPKEDFYTMSAGRCMDLCDKALFAWAKGNAAESLEVKP